MLKKIVVLIALLNLFALAGCTSTSDVKDSGADGGAIVDDRSDQTGGVATQGDDGASTSALPGQASFTGDPLDNPSSPLATRIIYFDYDSSEIQAEYQESVLAHGQYLAAHPEMTVTLEGHTDERGSREYNIGLGERRAQAVRRLLLFQGAADKQVSVVSYGEEKPVAEGHNESAYSENRRVEIIYKR